jgi:excisionase family DNA binding protein
MMKRKTDPILTTSFTDKEANLGSDQTGVRPSGEPKVRAQAIADFCKRYAVGRTFVYQEIKEGRLSAKKAGSRTLISTEDADAWFSSLPEMQTKVDRK